MSTSDLVGPPLALLLVDRPPPIVPHDQRRVASPGRHEKVEFLSIVTAEREIARPRGLRMGVSACGHHDDQRQRRSGFVESHVLTRRVVEAIKRSRGRTLCGILV
jgi:hypothetical protein